ncbi:MAG: MoaD/ThiS family protein [Desulfobacteraceae bacterium]|jgi:molybdopterin converting factor small subunit
MDATIDLRLYATLGIHTPDNASRFPIKKSMTIEQLLDSLPVTAEDAKLIFVDGIRAELTTQLQGGERVGIFPPVGGG